MGLIEAIVKIHFPQKGKEEMQVRTSVWGGVAGGSSWVSDSMSWTQLYAQAMLPSVVMEYSIQSLSCVIPIPKE